MGSVKNRVLRTAYGSREGRLSFCSLFSFSVKWALSPKFQREDLVRGQSTKGKLEDTLNLHQDPCSHSK